MKSAVKRILEQYTALQLYFSSLALEDPTHTNDSILRSLNNKFTEAYLAFMDFALGRFVSFNLLFQSEMPLLHQLKDEVERLVLSLCGDFMSMSYVRSTKAFDIDPNDVENHVPLHQVYVGILATDTIHNIEVDDVDHGRSHQDIQLFHTHCRDFLIEAVKQIQDRFRDCQKLDQLSCLSPSMAYNMKIPSLNPIYKEMPHLERFAELQKADQEWREHALGPNLSEEKTSEEYWQVVFKEKDAAGKLRYPNLVRVIKVLLSLPFSNAAVERVFSQLKLIKSDHRAALKQESLLALLTTKLVLLKSQGKQQAAKLEPPKEMLSLYKGMISNADNDEVFELRKEFIKKLLSFKF